MSSGRGCKTANAASRAWRMVSFGGAKGTSPSNAQDARLATPEVAVSMEQAAAVFKNRRRVNALE